MGRADRHVKLADVALRLRAQLGAVHAGARAAGSAQHSRSILSTSTVITPQRPVVACAALPAGREISAHLHRGPRRRDSTSVPSKRNNSAGRFRQSRRFGVDAMVAKAMSSTSRVHHRGR